MSIYKKKIEDTEEELKKVQETVTQYQQLEQRLLGRIITLNELQDEESLAEEPPVVDEPVAE